MITNNVENVYIHPDDVEIGNYTVRIRAKNIADDAVGLGYNSQDYALVVYKAANSTDPAFPSVFNMRGHQHDVNELEAYNLTNPSSYELKLESSSIDYLDDTSHTVRWGIRVFIRDENENEGELTLGAPEAIVSRSSSGSGYQSASWSGWFGSYEVEDKDALVVRVYAQIERKTGWIEQASFVTNRLSVYLNGETHINATDWTIYYYTKYATGLSLPPGSTTTFGYFYWGNVERNSRVEGMEFITPIGG